MKFNLKIKLLAILAIFTFNSDLIAQKSQKKAPSQKQKVTKCLTSKEWHYSEYAFGFNNDGSGYYSIGVLEPDNNVTWKYTGGNNVRVYIPYLAENGMNVTVKTTGGCKVYVPF